MPAKIQPQAIVVIRFSYLGESGWRLTHNGLEANRAALYDPARLKRRFHLFEALTLPSLLAQTDPDFTTAILIGTDFPKEWRTRLADMVKPLRDARVIALPPMKNFAATKQAIQLSTSTESHVITIRLDDDDAMSVDCIAEQKRLGPMVLEISGIDTPTIVSFNNGLFLKIADTGNRLFGVIESLPLGIGMGMIAPKTVRPTIFSTDHRQIHTRWNCYTDSVTPHFIRTVHGDNDSGARVYGVQKDYTDTELDQIMADRFPFTRTELLGLRTE
jgi:hypothetical protein